MPSANPTVYDLLTAAGAVEGTKPKKDKKTFLEGMRDLLVGGVAGVAGMPVDTANLLDDAARLSYPGYRRVSGEQSGVGGTDWIGQKLGADTDSGIFTLGTIGTPDLKDLVKLASLLGGVGLGLKGVGRAGGTINDLLKSGNEAGKGVESGQVLRNVPEGGRAGRLDKFEVPAGSRPEYLGAAPDRSDISYLRYTPARGAGERVEASIAALRDPNNPARLGMLEDIRRGQEMGGDSWYNTEELRDWFIDYWGPERGDAEWREFMYLVGATSPGSNVDANLKNASGVRLRLNEDPTYIDRLLEVEGIEDARVLGRERKKGYGHITQGVQELNVARQQQGRWEGFPDNAPPAQGSWVQNPKPKGFANSLLGNRRNMAADLHFTRAFGMATQDPRWLGTSGDVSDEFHDALVKANPKSNKWFGKRHDGEKDVWTFKPRQAVESGDVRLDEIADYPTIWEDKPKDIEYGAIEKFVADLARELGMTPAQLQANLWLGAAARTNVAPESLGTFMEIIRNRAAKTAAQEGISVKDVFDRFIKGTGTLMLPYAAVRTMNIEDMLNGQEGQERR